MSLVYVNQKQHVNNPFSLNAIRIIYPVHYAMI